MKTYIIKKELIKTDENGNNIYHYNIYYYIDGIEETKELKLQRKSEKNAFLF